MLHPYKQQPTRAFWRRGVLDSFDPLDLLDVPLPVVRADTPVASIGPCFAANVRPWLERAGLSYLVTEGAHQLWPEGAEASFYDAFSARYGAVYTARQLLQLWQRAFGRFVPAEDRWHEGREVIDPFRPGLRWRAIGDHEFDLLTAQHLAAVRQVFERAGVLVVTLGLTEAWESQIDGAVFPVCPGTVAGVFDPDRHQFHNFTVDEVTADLDAFLAAVHSVNPSLSVILTVSPQPMVATATDRHVVVANAYSKAILRVAADVHARSGRAFYFPAYELAVGTQAPADIFQADRRSVSPGGVALVMDTFCRAIGATGRLATDGPRQTFLARVDEAVREHCEEEMLDETGVEPTGATCEV